MKFRDFILKRLLADTDYLVGYDQDGKYIRISKRDLATSIANNVTVPTLQVQYSANASTWHDRYTSGDIYIRIKVGSGAWSDAIRISVSAFDVWRDQGNTGSEADFIASLRGEPGSVDLSNLQLRDINGYNALLDNVNASLHNARLDIINDVEETAVSNVMNQFKEMQLGDIKEVMNLTDSDYITIVTSDGLRKVKISTLTDNVALRTLNKGALVMSVNTQLVVLEVQGEQNGSNFSYQVGGAYILGTSHLFLNGQRLVSGEDYIEDREGFTMTSYAPIQNDSLIFVAAVK